MNTFNNGLPYCPNGYGKAYYQLLRLYSFIPGFDSYAKDVYLTIDSYVNPALGNIAWPSQIQLAMDTGISLAKLGKTIALLEEVGLITREKDPLQGNTIYRVNEPVSPSEFFDKFPQAKAEYEARLKKLKAIREDAKERMRKHRETKKSDEEQG